MSKYLYTYDVVRVDSGLNVPIARGFDTKAEATVLEIDATNNVPHREFKVRQRRHANPAYVPVSDTESSASRQHFIDTGEYLPVKA